MIVRALTCGIRNLFCHDFCYAKIHTMVPERLDDYNQATTLDIPYRRPLYAIKCKEDIFLLKESRILMEISFLLDGGNIKKQVLSKGWLRLFIRLIQKQIL